MVSSMARPRHISHGTIPTGPLLLMLLLLTLTGLSHGQQLSSLNGPYAAQISSIIRDPFVPTKLYASSVVFSYKYYSCLSTNNGDTWAILGKHVIAINPLNSENLFSRDERSSDGGNTWAPMGMSFYSISFDETTPGIVYATTRTIENGVFRSSNLGASWAVADSGLPNGLIAEFIAVNPMKSTECYLTTWGGLYQSTDGAISWHLAAFSNDTVATILIDKSDTASLYVAGAQGLHITHNSGASWLTCLDTLVITSVSLDGGFPGKVLAGTSAGLFESTDGGAVWTRISFVPSSLEPIGVDAVDISPFDSQVIFVGTYYGVFRSLDGGVSWKRTVDGMTPSQIGDIDISSQGTLFAIGDGGLFRRNKDETSWSLVSKLGDVFSRVRVSPASEETLYVSTSNALFSNTTRVSTNGGKSWTDAPIVGRDGDLAVITIDPLDSRRVYSSEWGAGTWRSTDAGMNWQPLNVPAIPSCIVADPIIEGTLYLGSAGPRIYKSIDDGMTWDTLTISPSYSAVLFMSINPSNTNEIVAATFDEGVFESSDGGVTWLDATQNLPSRTIYAATTNPSDPAEVFVSTAGRVFRKRVQNTVWIEVGSGFPQGEGNFSVAAMKIDGSGYGRLYAGIQGDSVSGGVYALDGISAVTDQKETLSNFQLAQNYPNPFNGQTIIRYSLDQTLNVTVGIYDLLGRRIVELFKGREDAGQHFIRWNGTDDSGLPVSSGVYFFKLASEQSIRTRKLILLH